jgi:hypothetical protein
VTDSAEPRSTPGAAAAPSAGPRSVADVLDERYELSVLQPCRGTTMSDALLRRWLAILPHPFTPEDEVLHAQVVTFASGMGRSPARCRAGSSSKYGSTHRRRRRAVDAAGP